MKTSGREIVISQPFTHPKKSTRGQTESRAELAGPASVFLTTL